MMRELEEAVWRAAKNAQLEFATDPWTTFVDAVDMPVHGQKVLEEEVESWRGYCRSQASFKTPRYHMYASKRD